MAYLDATMAEVLVFTFKDGTLLSALAHDLKLTVTKFVLDVEGDSVKAEFDAASLEVVCAMKDGKEDPGALPSFAAAQIHKHIVDDVLEARTFPTIRFETTQISDAQVKGRLSLHGQTRELVGVRKDSGGKRVAEFHFDQRDFGIKPFSAMLGALKVKAEVVVRVAF
jgi:hypothetical protein